MSAGYGLPPGKLPLSKSHGALLPTDPELKKACPYADARGVLVSRDLNSATHTEDRELLGGTLLTIDGDDHRQRRRLEAKLFSSEALASLEREVLEPAITANFERLKNAGEGAEIGGTRADLVQFVRHIILPVAAAVVGLDDVRDEDRILRLGACLDGLTEGTMVEFSTRDHQQVLEEALRWKVIYRDEFVRPSLTRRREAKEATERELSGSPSHPSLIAVLLQEPAEEWDDEGILRECILYLGASVVTTTNAVTHTVTNIWKWLDEHPEHREVVRDKEFLRRASLESLRLHPGPHILLRRAVKDVVIGEISLKEGELVGADLTAANRDGSIYGDDADTFDPYRLTGLDDKPPWDGLTFGGGRHKCLGRPLVLGTYERGKVDSYGSLLRILHALFKAGLTPDLERSRDKADSHMNRYLHYPVIFTNV